MAATTFFLFKKEGNSNAQIGSGKRNRRAFESGFSAVDPVSDFAWKTGIMKALF